MEDKNRFADFQKVYIKSVAPLIQVLEEKRLESLNSYKILVAKKLFYIVMLFIIIPCLLFFGTKHLYFMADVIWLSGISLFCILCRLIYNFPKCKNDLNKRYKEEFKSKIFSTSNLLDIFGISNKKKYSDCTCESYKLENSKVNIEQINKSNLFGLFTSPVSIPDDSYEGIYKNVKYEIEEYHSSCFAGYNGVVILFDSKRKFVKNSTIVTTKHNESIKHSDKKCLFLLICFSIIILVLCALIFDIFL